MLQLEDLRAKLATQGIDVVGGPPEALREELLAEFAKWERVIKAGSLKAD